MTGTRVLLYVPGIQASEENSAQRIAELIARSESIDRPGEYSVRNVGNSKDATILAPNLEPVLRVVEVSFDSQLNWSEAAKPETTIKALVRSVRFTVLASIRLLAAWRRPAKSTRAKIQLGLGLLAVLVLFATVVIVALALVAAIRPSALPEWMASESAVPRLAWAAGGLTAGGLFWWARPRLLEAGKLVRTIMRYAEQGRHRASVATEVNRTIDLVLEKDSATEIYLLGYSFGSLVAIDALFPSVPRQDGGRAVSAIRGLVTVGCPVDLIRLYYPNHFEGRQSICPELSSSWTNLFIPADVLGSNFLDGSDRQESAAENAEPFTIDGVGPSDNVAVSNEQLGLVGLLSLEGFQLHSGYWDTPERVSHLESVIPQWIAPTPVPPLPNPPGPN